MMNQAMKKLSTFSRVAVLTAFLTGCGGSSGGGTVQNPSKSGNGDVSKLTYTAPNIIPSLNNANNSGYVVITNTSSVDITDINYKLANEVGGGNKIYIDDSSKTSCRNIMANAKCMMKIIVPAGTDAGSFSINADNSSTKSSKYSVKATTATTIAIQIGIEVATNSNVSGPDGISLYYHQNIIAGTPYMIVTGYVSSPNIGNFNNVVLIDENGNHIPNQQVLSGNIGAGLTNVTQGSTFEILIPLSSNVDTTQTFKLQTSELSKDNITSNIQTTNDLYSVTTIADKANLSVLPSNLILNSNNNTQTITLYNNGSTPAQLKELTSNNNNIAIQVTPGEISSGKFITATISLKSTDLPATNSNLILTYNDGTKDVSYQLEVLQDTKVSNSANPVAGLKLEFEPDNNDFTLLTNSKPISQKLILTNTGNTNETGFNISGLAAGFSISNGTSSQPCIISGNSITNTLTTSGEDYWCDLTINYTGATSPTSGVGTINIAYNYDGSSVAEPAQLSYNYRVIQGSANISFTTPETITFHSILNNNNDSANEIVTIINSGNIDATNLKPTIDGAKAQLFSIDNSVSGIQTPCKSTLAAGASCQIGIKFGPTSLTPANSLDANIEFTYSSENKEKTSSTTNLVGSIIAAQSANINASITNTSGFIAGNGSKTTPFMLQTNTKASITYTIINSGKSNATKFFISPITNLGRGWSITNNCGSPDKSITLNANGGKCDLIFTLSPQTSGNNDLNFSLIKTNWTDQTFPQGTNKTMSSSLYVNAYAPASITITTTLDATNTILTGESFNVIAELTGGYNVAPQTVSLNPITPINNLVSYANNNCKISSSTPTCTVEVNTNAVSDEVSAPANSYTITLAPIEGVNSTLPNITFSMKRLRIFTTINEYNGDLGGFSGADAKCNADANKPKDGGNFKALLWDNNATQKSVSYFRLDNTTLIANADGGFLTMPTLDNSILSSTIKLSTNVWVGWLRATQDFNCKAWTSAISGEYGAFNININHNGSTIFTPTSSSDCDQLMSLYCVEQP